MKMKRKPFFRPVLPILVAAAMISGCGASPDDAAAVPSADSSKAEAVSDTSAQSISSMELPETAAQSASSAAAPTETPTEAPTPEPTPEETLPDGTIHTMLEEAGSVYIAENRAFSPYYFASESGDAYAGMLNTVSERLGGVRTWSILAPTSFAVCLGQEVQDAMYCSDEASAIDYTWSMVSGNVHTVPILDTLKKHNAEYLFFATDHHWTQLGAYYAYREWCAAAGITPHELADYQQAAYPGFLGLFYDYSGYAEALAANPDTVYAYTPIATNDMTVSDGAGNEYPYPVVKDVSADDAGTKYSAFIGGDSALCSIHNPLLSDGSACILIKDSFGNAFAPFLVDHFENVYVVDFRYYSGNLTAFAQEHGVTDVIILTNVDEILQSSSEAIQALF